MPSTEAATTHTLLSSDQRVLVGVVFVGLSVLTAIGLFRHAFWFDELQAT